VVFRVARGAFGVSKGIVVEDERVDLPREITCCGECADIDRLKRRNIREKEKEGRSRRKRK